MGLLRRDGETQMANSGSTLILPPYFSQPFLRKPDVSPDSLAICQLFLELDEGHIIVIKFRNAFFFFPIDVVLGVK